MESASILCNIWKIHPIFLKSKAPMNASNFKYINKYMYIPKIQKVGI